MSETVSRSGSAPRVLRWSGSAALLCLGVGFAAVLVLAGAPRLALAAAAASLAAAWWNSPARRGGHESLASIRGALNPGEVVVLWHPGCPFSADLRRRLRRDGSTVHWVNIWHDAEGAALCRSLNHGAEQVPTVVVLDEVSGAPVVIPATCQGIRDARPLDEDHRSASAA